ncbi:glycoside hydrolase family 88 protein [Haliscomenobacter hydrossis]|uniref:Glycosyl hydrolase family 88 n=1 Tax=Haliscomenobacter hydrossis (strain ATCC 27775 / DSM 1100 / LMG 10767 / O) TaxID=760192 RepID=F4KQV4_HALH1|nr:glycoside hydrolase family 88 protein [Haliscomenobacter hydrossis]AEE52239.1 glycosyl hydrolase family 88 [Haliscomenobacter hydrossis DSM 1100]
MRIKSFCLLLMVPFCLSQAVAQNRPWSQRMAESFMDTHKDSILVGANKFSRWDYEQGLMLESFKRLWQHTGDVRYFNYIKKDIDHFVKEDGSIRTFKLEDFNIDNMPTGRALLLMYQETKKEKYKKAAYLLRRQLSEHPRTKENGFWHKKRYPNQMWLDGLYMGHPFFTEFSVAFNEPANFNDIALQFALVEKHMIDSKTGLLYHGYDESRQQPWANPATGCSPNFWGRAVGWYAMGLVDVLDNFPQDHPERGKFITYLQRLAPVLVKYQDASGCWWQILDKANEKGNYLEASASCMFTYALAKGVRMGYLNASFLPAAKKGFQGIISNFISTEASGKIHLEKTVSVGGLGGVPYRDGSYEYYLSEPLRKDDLKGVGPFIQAALEIEIAETNTFAKGKNVVLDYFFNNEYRKGLNGQTERFHYTWEDPMDSGFSTWGNLFREYGANTLPLTTAPSVAALKTADVYIIVDPDTKKETAVPNFIGAEHINVIKAWVKKGGVLMLMANDTANCEIPHFNQLSSAFGISFSGKSRNMVKNDVYEQGKVPVPAGHPIFSGISKLFVKELVTLNLSGKAKASISEGGDVIMATAKYGKGTVFVIGDPWIYNEYVNGKRLPPMYENFQAARLLAKWLLEQSK